MIRLIIGGCRSGKSSFAEKIARTSDSPDIYYLATAEIRDEEMRDRVEKHQGSRPESWQTIEEPYHVSKEVEIIPDRSLVLLDCITLLISNILLQGDEAGKDESNYSKSGSETDVMNELKSLIKVARKKEVELIMVSNEVGMGLVPNYRLGREYRDISGRANQFLAKESDEVYITYAGLPIEIKEMGMNNLARFER